MEDIDIDNASDEKVNTYRLEILVTKEVTSSSCDSDKEICLSALGSRKQKQLWACPHDTI